LVSVAASKLALDRHFLGIWFESQRKGDCIAARSGEADKRAVDDSRESAFASHGAAYWMVG
jgi:hypothetical protein